MADAPMSWKLPADLLREIIARSDHHRTLVRFAATSNLLRRDILSPPIDPRFTEAAPHILAYMCPDAKKPLLLVHPTNPAAASFCHQQLSRFISRKVARILCKYQPVASRRGLVVLLRRRNSPDPPPNTSHLRYDTCVYDPMSGAQSFFYDPPQVQSGADRKYVLLTAADGVDTDSFLLLVFDFRGWEVTLHTASSRGAWASVTLTVTYEGFDDKNCFPLWALKKRGDPAILDGGVVHWLPLMTHGEIISYDLGTGKMGSVKLPPTENNNSNQLYLATSTDRKRLKLLAIQGYKLFVWLQIPVFTGGDSAAGWSLETVIDMKEKIRSVYPRILFRPNQCVYFEGSGNRTGDVVFLVMKVVSYGEVIAFDLEKKEMHRQKQGLALLEIDLPSRLRAMKIFS